jgi:hypothetical protein
MTKAALRALAEQAARTHSVTKVAQGARAYGEREMYLRTEATDRELDEERIERSLAQRQKRMSLEQAAETKAQQMYEDRRARMGY